uniref:Uncharacterized protein n=1 Tax=Cacopsylla melanoneura TaxID=428564 RepID=A0A8D8Z4F0_9HEMI
MPHNFRHGCPIDCYRSIKIYRFFGCSCRKSDSVFVFLQFHCFLFFSFGIMVYLQCVVFLERLFGENLSLYTRWGEGQMALASIPRGVVLVLGLGILFRLPVVLAHLFLFRRSGRCSFQYFFLFLFARIQAIPQY